MFLVISDILFWINLVLLVWWGYIVIFNRGVPNIPTAPVIRRKVVEIIRADMQEKGLDQYTVVDLGSGNGSFARMIAKEIPQAHVVGVEISALAVKRANMMKKFFRVKNVDYICADFDSYNLGHVDAAVIFLMASSMHSMGKKLNEELKPGALVCCNRFMLQDGWIPKDTVFVKTIYPLQGKLNIYRK
jgi:ubiquinone/menaquinone biosynthesis C-methylase UbiE